MKIMVVASLLSFTVIDYVLHEYETYESVLNKLRKFKIIWEVYEVKEATIKKGLSSRFEDFEDAVHYFTTLQSKCSIIVARSGKEYKHFSISIMKADECLSSIDYSCNEGK